MNRILEKGAGWRIGWNPKAPDYPGLVGGEDWALELTAAEFTSFCQLLRQLTDAITAITPELMAEEQLQCEAEDPALWLEAFGSPDAFSIRLILQQGRRGEGNWPAAVIPDLLSAIQTFSNIST